MSDVTHQVNYPRTCMHIHLPFTRGFLKLFSFFFKCQMCTRLQLHENLLPRRPVDQKRGGNRHGLSFRLEMVLLFIFMYGPYLKEPQPLCEILLLVSITPTLESGSSPSPLMSSTHYSQRCPSTSRLRCTWHFYLKHTHFKFMVYGHKQTSKQIRTCAMEFCQCGARSGLPQSIA